MKTFVPREDAIERHWYVVDAEGQVLGRLASKVAYILKGKGKPIWSPHIDVGDHVVVVNAAKVRLTGRKLEKKMFFRHTLYPGGATWESLATRMRERPDMVVEQTIRRMLPRNRLGRAMVKKLKVYAGPEHPHQAQQPEVLDLGRVLERTPA
jgi:large subunit ribosomal protein L13